MSASTSFEFATAQRIVFGAGKVSLLPEIACEFGRKALVVTGSKPERHATVIEALRAEIESVDVFAVDGEPTVPLVLEGVKQAKAAGVEFIVGIGGGSAIDAGKAIAAFVANPGDPLDYLEVVGKGLPLPEAPLPFVAVPTTAGTGAEVTRNAVLSVPDMKAKVSLRSPRMLPTVALVDPELTHGLSSAHTATTGLDALTQLIEPFLSWKANPLTDALCRDGIPRAARALPICVVQPDHELARQEMAQASLFGGLALANAGLGAVHGFAGPIGGMFPAPHGALCAVLLPFVLEANLAALRAREPENPILSRFDALGLLLTGNPQARADDAVTWCANLVGKFGIPRLSVWGVTEAQIPVIVGKARRASSMKANPLVLTPEELGAILREAL